MILIDVQSGKKIKELSYSYPIRDIQFDRDGSRFWLTPTYPARDPFVYDRKGVKHTDFNQKEFAPLQNAIFTHGGSKDASLWIVRGDTKSKLVADPFDYLLTDDGVWLACSTSTGDVVVWRSSDLKEVYRTNFGRHPIHLRFDAKRNRILVGTANITETATLQAIEIQTPK